MKNPDRRGAGGWLVVYLVGSIPLFIMYSIGLSGWFFEYPLGLVAAIYLVLQVPLLLIVIGYRKAPWWNVVLLWTVAALITLRSISVFLEPGGGELINSDELLSAVLTLSAVVLIAVGWAVVWTKYFKLSQRVRNTFPG